MKAYMKGHFDFFGIQARDRRSLQRDILEDHALPQGEEFLDLIQELWHDPHREMQYFAMDLLDRSKAYRDAGAIDLFEWLVTTKSWWDTVDFIASTLCGKYFRIYPDSIDHITTHWNDSESIWLIRTSILIQLKYKTDVDLGLFERLSIPHLDSRESFLQKRSDGCLERYQRPILITFTNSLRSTRNFLDISRRREKHLNTCIYYEYRVSMCF